MNVVERIHNYASLIRFSHTVFALPFALSSVALAWPAHPPTARTLLWIVVAMVGARSAAMGFNRLVDQKFDALNPRTSAWELPQGNVKVWEAVLLTLAAALGVCLRGVPAQFPLLPAFAGRLGSHFFLFVD
jgi:4-hydroxybenzoate polyprenyltransferase